MYCYLLNYRLPDFWLMVVNNRIVINISVRKEKTKKKIAKIINIIIFITELKYF